jgi:YVTN family beta-propeller protein
VSKTVTVGTQPYRLSVNPTTNKIYVANYGSNNVSVINGATDTVSTTVGVGNGPIATSANSATNKIYVSNYTAGSVSVINGSTDTVSKTITVGTNPYGLGANSSSNKVYVANNGSNSVSIINGSTDTVTKTVTVGTNPRGAGVDTITNLIYVPNYGSNSVSKIDGSTDTVTATITVGTQPFDAGVNTSTTKIYVANYGGNNVSVINGKNRAFYCVAAAAANRVWAGADDGWIRYYNGTTWVIQNPDPSYSNGYYGISAPDITHVWAVGASGKIVYWNGTSWAKQISNTTSTLRAVTSLNASTAWAVGDGGVIRYTSDGGTTWQTQDSGTTQNLLGVSAADATHVWAVGAGGTILFYNGTSWATQTSPTTNNLRAVYAYDANDAWAVGDNGTIIFADPPYIKECAPGCANPGDTVDVEVVGAYTHFEESTPTVSFGDGVSVDPDSVKVIDNTHILAQVQVDSGAALGPRNVNATTAGEVPTPLAGGFVVGAAPTIASVSRSSAPRGWTGDVDVKGSQTIFSPASQATFGSGITVNSVTYRDAYEVTVNIAVDTTAAPGPRSVNVTTDSETPTPLADGFTVATPPGIIGVSPGEGLTGSEVTVTGSDFGSSQGTSTITFNGIPAIVTSDHWADGVITTTVPFGATTGPVVVNTAGGASNDDQVFTVDVVLPTITSLSPTSATTGTTVYINGSNFGDTMGSSYVMFGSTKLINNYNSWSASKIGVKVPSAVSRTCLITVYVDGVGASNARAFKVKPRLTSLSPTSGKTGSKLTIYGTAFGSKKYSSSYVKVGSKIISGNYDSWSNTKIVVKVPSGISGTQTVTVTTLGGTSAGKSYTVKK